MLRPSFFVRKILPLEKHPNSKDLAIKKIWACEQETQIWKNLDVVVELPRMFGHKYGVYIPDKCYLDLNKPWFSGLGMGNLVKPTWYGGLLSHGLFLALPGDNAVYSQGEDLNPYELGVYWPTTSDNYRERSADYTEIFGEDF